jgi:hypothetical protein
VPHEFDLRPTKKKNNKKVSLDSNNNKNPGEYSRNIHEDWGLKIVFYKGKKKVMSMTMHNRYDDNAISAFLSLPSVTQHET